MKSTRHDDSHQARAARARQAETEQRRRATRTVAAQAQDGAELTGLLSMLGLDDGPAGSSALLQSLAKYVNHVAEAVGVPPDATSYEVTDTATAYVGLNAQSHERDLMLLWDERTGWCIGTEAEPAETSQIIGRLRGDTVPVPATVAQFVADVVAGRPTTTLGVVQPAVDRLTLAKRIAATLGRP